MLSRKTVTWACRSMLVMPRPASRSCHGARIDGRFSRNVGRLAMKSCRELNSAAATTIVTTTRPPKISRYTVKMAPVRLMNGIAVTRFTTGTSMNARSQARKNTMISSPK
jgi:hypothetical protein